MKLQPRIMSSLQKVFARCSDVARRRSVAVAAAFGFAITCMSLLGPMSSTGQSTSAQAINVEVLSGQSATRLSDGRILLLGGARTGRIAQLFDPQTGQRTTLVNSLHYARTGHSATVLPDGTVLVSGGMSTDGTLVNINEVYEPASATFTELPGYWTTPRAYHTATLLTDGHLLIAGGRDEFGNELASAEVWDVSGSALWSTGPASTARSVGSMDGPRQNALATLLDDGSVLIERGQGTTAGGVTTQRFHPETGAFESVIEVRVDAAGAGGTPHLAASIPADGADNVALDDYIALRFSEPLPTGGLSNDSLTLSGPRGVEGVRVTIAEAGRLAFVKPLSTLQPDANYALRVRDATISFTTIPRSGVEHGGSRYPTLTPGPKHPAGDSDAADTNGSALTSPASGQPSETAPVDYARLPPRQAPRGMTALAGQVLLQDGHPLARVTLSIDSISVRTDATGRFLLKNVPSGHHELLIDGRSANSPRAVYGIFEAGVDIVSSVTTVLPYTIWMPALETANAVPLPSPTAGEMVITTPRIPGLELHLPAGTRIIGHDGSVAREIGITAIPVEKPPFPLPANVEVPIYFTIQPGAAYVYTPTHAKAWLVYPNYKNQPPGTRANFWHYDPEEKGWYVYGQGTVTEDGKQVRPDPGVGIYEFTGAMVAATPAPPQDAAPPGGCKKGDPVDCATGLFLHQVTDLYLRDTLPLSFTRVYRTRDTTSRPFGVGANHTYGIFLYSTQNYTQADLILPDGARIHYVRTSAGTGYADAVYEHVETGTTSATPTEFYKSRLSWNGTGWDLTLKNGLTYIFGDMAPLQAIRDRNGNRIQLTWSTTNAFGSGAGNLTRITSPNGRWIALTYDTSGRITQAQDNIGRTVSYSYNTAGDLSSVTDVNAKTTSYTYDSSHRMLTWTDPRNNVVVTNQYDTSGRVSQQTYADTTTNQFAYATSNGKITQIDVTDERGNVQRLSFNSDGYVTSKVRALGTSVEQTTTYTRQSGTNFVTSVTNPIGHRTDYSYDGRGNVTSVTRLAETSSPLTTSYTYDATYSQVTSVTDPLNHATSLSYDSRGNLTTITDALNHSSSITNNSAGQPLTITDALSHVSTLSYVRGDWVATQNALGNTVKRQIDAAGRLVGVTDALGNKTSIQYDNHDRPTQFTDPSGAVASFAYDGNGNLTSFTDPRSGVVSYTYDSRNRVNSRTDGLTHSESYTYDGAGNLSQRTERNGKISTFTYDALSRLTLQEFGRTQQGQSLSSPDATVSISWDAANRVTQFVDTQGGTVTRTFDDANRAFSEATSQGTVSYTFDAAYRRATMTVAGQSAVSYSYDAANRLTGLTQGSTTVGLTYDNADRRSTLTLPNGAVSTYSYDAANQLTGIQYTYNSSTLGDFAYAYDAAGHRTGMSGSFSNVTLPSAVSTTSYNSAQRLTSWSGQTLSYDNNGNLTSDGVNTYTWDSRNRLTSTGSATFGYDALGRRTTRSASGSTAAYLYDGPNAVQELSGSTVIANILNGLGVDERFSRTDAAGRRSFLVGALGSTLALVDDAGAVQTSYAYGAYGETLTTGAASSSSYQFTGRENDGGGLYFYRARAYHASYARFLSEDPIGLQGGMNLYAYTRGDPISSRDPYGHIPWGDIFFDAATGAMTDGAAAAVQGDSVGGSAAEGGVVGGATAAIPGGTPAKAAAGAVAGAVTGDQGNRAADAWGGAAAAAAPAEAGFGAAMIAAINRRANEVINGIAALLRGMDPCP
jgi:RHS repeat-associated protein